MAIYDGPGFRFHPTDEEIICFYLKRKLTGNLPPAFDHFAVIDIYKFEPWDLPSLSKLKTKDLEWYFFTVLDKKYGNSLRLNRATDRGYWKTTGKDRIIKNGKDVVGMKKTLVYHSGRAPRGDRTNWVMHEYKMVNETLARAGMQDTYVLCRVFEKSGSGPKNGEKYGAPFIEAEWEHVGRLVDPVLPVGNELMIQEVFAPASVPALAPAPVLALAPYVGDQVDPLPTVGNESLKQEVSASAPTDDDFVEAKDLDEKFDDTSDTIGNADLASIICYGESSSYPPQHSQTFLSDHKQMEPEFALYGNQIDQPDNMADIFNVNINYVQDGYNGETNHNENPLNFNFEFEDPDEYFDVCDYLMSSEEAYEETNDFKNLDEAISIETDPSVAAAMVDEYLAFPEEDIFQHVCFESSLNVGSESPIANHGQPFVEQNVESDTNNSPLASKHVLEGQSSNEPSFPEGNAEVSNWVSGDANYFVRQANKLLAHMPASPAFASEFPTVEFAHGISAAAESSSSAHITAGMISITDISFRGNAMDWMVGKNGDFNTIGFTQTDVNSATLVPISDLVCSKTAFMLSHGWVFLVGFSVVVLSLSFKIGSFMYTGK
ncbi:NAC domain-containing protein 53-like isoform X2 [Vicia villosa]|uniref:NAC domain-containing protein 53-like isoform X2 n=1 Tax=Vicia villosa TaxID=3911 RepID=UPI00273B34A8|nr:NAC domain-containing protein 53-like isoform X2 [Vicia villosa]